MTTTLSSPPPRPLIVPTKQVLTPAPKPDRAAIVQTYKMIVGEGNVTELRVLDAVLHTDRAGWRESIYFGFFDNAEDFADAAMSVRSAVSWYFIPNPVVPDLLYRAVNRLRRGKKDESVADKHILRRKWILIDADCVRPTGISSTDAEHEAARLRAADIWLHCHDHYGWGDPIEADSGNGWHMMYRCDLPADDGGLVAHILAELANKFSDNTIKLDVTVANPARIWKLYGTPACKGDHSVARPHRLSRIVRYPHELRVVEPLQ